MIDNAKQICHSVAQNWETFYNEAVHEEIRIVESTKIQNPQTKYQYCYKCLDLKKRNPNVEVPPLVVRKLLHRFLNENNDELQRAYTTEWYCERCHARLTTDDFIDRYVDKDPYHEKKAAGRPV